MAITITSPGGKAEVSGPRWFVETTSTADTPSSAPTSSQGNNGDVWLVVS